MMDWFDRIGIDRDWKHRRLVGHKQGFLTLTVDPADGVARIWFYDHVAHSGTLEEMRRIYDARCNHA